MVGIVPIGTVIRLFSDYREFGQFLFPAQEKSSRSREKTEADRARAVSTLGVSSDLRFACAF